MRAGAVVQPVSDPFEGPFQDGPRGLGFRVWNSGCQERNDYDTALDVSLAKLFCYLTMFRRLYMLLNDCYIKYSPFSLEIAA